MFVRCQAVRELDQIVPDTGTAMLQQENVPVMRDGLVLVVRYLTALVLRTASTVAHAMEHWRPLDARIVFQAGWVLIVTARVLTGFSHRLTVATARARLAGSAWGVIASAQTTV